MISSIDQLLNLMKQHGATKFYAKRLAPNDNSKNQIYLGGDYSSLNILPYFNLHTDAAQNAGSKRDRIKADLKFYWLSNSAIYRAPRAGLILYPKYPEVRMSGFLMGCAPAPSAIMNSRDAGRVLFLGFSDDGRIIGYASGKGDNLTKSFEALQLAPTDGVFVKLSESTQSADSFEPVKQKLLEIHNKGWIESKRLNASGVVIPYKASNGGGYTLEAELGIKPNGYAEPDYLGWEVKQYGCKDFISYTAKSPITLMTPEPTGGVYKDEGFEIFMRRFGYEDTAGRPNRLNFGGVYKCDFSFHPRTGVMLTLQGYNPESKKIIDPDGGIVLIDESGEIAAKWSFSGIMEHWKRKHARAVYVPSLKQVPPKYHYASEAFVCKGTDFILLLDAIVKGKVYYDPGIKIVFGEKGTETKKRSQFRIKRTDLACLYKESAVVQLTQ